MVPSVACFNSHQRQKLKPAAVPIVPNHYTVIAQQTVRKMGKCAANVDICKTQVCTYLTTYSQVMPMEERFALVERVKARANAQVRAAIRIRV
jgi:hypothetical protein